MFLQSYVFPICLYSLIDGKANIQELIGSGFFINDGGCFLTAKHVIESAVASATAKDCLVGLVLKGENGKSEKSVICELKDYEFAPDGYDIAIGVIDYHCESLLTLGERNVEPWQDVVTYGYPLHAVSGNPELLRLNIRCHKGYVQRLLRPEDATLTPIPKGFELSFLLSRGLSGSPLFIHQQQKDIVVGVCVGSFRTELIEDEYLEVMENGSEYKETKLKIEEYGIAHDIRPLHSWKPKILNGTSLFEATV
ncbi:hypothetical protein IDSA_05500 [Pseudidiomarina salinarum]|uniref:Serine protease n=1 Tax=Pseudidiomarina salinarum TaxID=435908 RepID=A0A094IYD0_9GAMM|nr:serine protease [Pseudidiomarina salinarum]KFZ32122.1 hypothetical protein IDSA_05500 [Pseudidiomarina salinarum]RUO70094.1 serine protease [Pseudidiomarina salinarum]